MDKDNSISTQGPGFNFWSGEIGRGIANDSPPLRCFFGAVLPRCSAAEMGPATHYTFRRNATSTMKDLIFDLNSRNTRMEINLWSSLLSCFYNNITQKTEH